MAHGCETAGLRLLGLVKRRVSREVKINFGQCYQRYNVEALNGNASTKVLEADITREGFADLLKVQGESSDEVFGKVAPVGGRCCCD